MDGLCALIWASWHRKVSLIMFGFGKSEKAKSVVKVAATASSQVREDMGLPEEPDAPWLAARRHHDNLFLQQSVQIQNWQRAFGWAMMALIGMTGGVVFMASQSQVEPVFVQVDKLGRTHSLAAGVGEGSKVDMGALIHREMKDFIVNVRTVSSDYSANNVALNKAFSRLTGAAHTYVKNDLLSHKPNDVAEKKTILVEINIAFPITSNGERNTWQVEWTETSYDLKGEQLGAPEMWKANIQYERKPGRTIEEVDENPIGFHIPTMSWAKMN